MSPPAENARSPVAVTTMRVTAESSRQAASCAASARTIGWVTAFRACGRLRVTRPAAPRRSNRMSGLELMLRPDYPQASRVSTRPRIDCPVLRPTRGSAMEPSAIPGSYGPGETCKEAALRQRMKQRRADAGLRKALVQRFWRTARRFWTEEARAVAWLMTVSLVVITVLQLFIQYRINVWNRDIFDAIEKKNAGVVLSQAMLFIPLAV